MLSSNDGSSIIDHLTSTVVANLDVNATISFISSAWNGRLLSFAQKILISILSADVISKPFHTGDVLISLNASAIRVAPSVVAEVTAALVQASIKSLRSFKSTLTSPYAINSCASLTSSVILPSISMSFFDFSIIILLLC